MRIRCLSADTVLGVSEVPRPVTIARGFIFENKAVLTVASQSAITDLKRESRRQPLQERRIRFA
jgi:hypothetical protein